MPGLGPVPSFFFERPYVTGVVSDKIPLSCYKNPEFIEKLSGLLGLAAAFTLVLGRVSFRTGKVYFDDGDELIQLDLNSIPARLVIIETTGSFTDWTTPIADLLPQCLGRFTLQLEKAASSGVRPDVIKRSISLFADALCNKLHETRQALLSPSSDLRSLFDDRPAGQGGIRDRWESIIHRLETVDIEAVRQKIKELR